MGDTTEATSEVASDPPSPPQAPAPTAPEPSGAFEDESGAMEWLKANAHKHQDTLEGHLAVGMGLAGADDESGAGGESGGPVESAPDSPLYGKALQALKRGLPKGMQGMIENMSQEDVLENGLALAEQQAEVDRLRPKDKEQGDTEPDSGDQAKDSSTDSGDDATASEPAEGDSLDLSARLEPLEDLYGEDLVPALTGIVQDITKATQAQVAKEMGTLFKGLQEYARADVGRQLEERFPMLREANNRAEVYTVLDKLQAVSGQDPRVVSRDQLAEDMELACIKVFGAKASSQGKSRSKGKGRKQPPLPTRQVASQNQDRSADERSMEWLRTYKDTDGNVAAANRASGF